MEIWKQIKDYETLYEISNYGNIRSLDKMIYDYNNDFIYTEKAKCIKTGVANIGYYSLKLFNNGKRKGFSIHRLVALNFIPNPENKPCVNHKDGNKLNNHYTNLEWCTYKENNKHEILTGLRTKTCNKKVKNTITGFVYNSICEAAILNGYKPDHLWKILNGKIKNKTSFILFNSLLP